MGLMQCKECGKEISEKAYSCPNCGCPVNASTEKSNNKMVYIILGLIAIAIVVIAIVLNQNKKPANISDEAYQLGIDAILVSDKYIDGIYDYDTASDKLESIKDKIDRLHEEDGNTYTFILGTDVTMLSSTLLKVEIDGSETDVINTRNDLAKKLNYKKR